MLYSYCNELLRPCAKHGDLMVSVLDFRSGGQVLSPHTMCIVSTGLNAVGVVGGGGGR